MTGKVTERRKSARQLIAIGLALVMFLGSALAFDQAIAFQQNQSAGFELELNNLPEYLPELLLNDATNLEEFASYEGMAFFDEEISENRRNYLKLLMGGYHNYQLRQQFVELFGDGFSGEYIFNNYRTIFDLKEGEIIDAAFLRVLSGYRIDFRFQNTDNHNMRGLASDDGRVRIFPDSDMHVPSESMRVDTEIDEAFLERIMESILVCEDFDGNVALSYNIDAHTQEIGALSTSAPRITLVSRTNYSIHYVNLSKKMFFSV